MTEQLSPTDASSSENRDPSTSESHIKTDNTSTTPLAAPSIEGWPPASHMVIPPPIRDVVMTDSISTSNDLIESLESSTCAANTGSSADLSLAPARTNNPTRNTSSNEINTRSNSQHPDNAQTIPNEAPPHGAPTRRFLNENVTGVLLDGLKIIVKERPTNPLQVLGEYLIQRSKEINLS